MTTPISTLRKTRTAVDYVYRHATGLLTRAHALDVLHAISACQTASGDPSVRASRLRNLLTTVRECAGQAWLSCGSDHRRRMPRGLHGLAALHMHGNRADTLSGVNGPTPTRRTCGIAARW